MMTMSNFQLSKQANPNKIFLTKFSELEGRFDPHFHKLEFKNIEKKINLSGFNTPKLKYLFEINRGGSPRPISQYFTDDENGVNWIKIGDTKKVNKYIYKTKQKIKPEGIKFSREVIEGDFILSNSMSFGRPYIMKTTGCIHDGWLLFRPKTQKASKDYLHTILGTNFIYKLFKKQTIGGVVENLNIDLVKNIKIPIPPKNIQAEIVAKMDKVYQSKKNKETQAQNLLADIDTYLLNELGIDLPKQSDNSLKTRIFTKKFSDIAGGRFDPFFNMPLFSQAENNIVKSKFNCVILDKLVFSISGITYKATDESKDGHAILRGNNIDLYNNELNFRKIRFIDNNLKLSNLSKLYKNDILMSSASGSKDHVGKVAFIERNIDYYFGAFMSVLRPKKVNYSHKYLFNFLSSKIYRLMLFRFLGGTNINNVGFEKIKNFPIPLPPLEKQKQIAEHISQIRHQAKQLQTEAKTELKQAKQEIETMILGGN